MLMRECCAGKYWNLRLDMTDSLVWGLKSTQTSCWSWTTLLEAWLCLFGRNCITWRRKNASISTCAWWLLLVMMHYPLNLHHSWKWLSPFIQWLLVSLFFSKWIMNSECGMYSKSSEMVFLLFILSDSIILNNFHPGNSKDDQSKESLRLEMVSDDAIILAASQVSTWSHNEHLY